MDYKIDLHTHTLASGHAYNTIDEMVEYAGKKGMTHLGITEHAPKMPGTCHEFYFSNLKAVLRQRDGLELLLGSEVNIIDYKGKIDLRTGILKQMDVVIASLHTPCIQAGTADENTAAYIGAMENPYVNIIGHPDDGRFPINYEAFVKKAKETKTLIEINNNSLRPTNPREGTRENDLEILKLCKKYGVMVVFGSDAHVKEDIGNFDVIKEVVAEVDFPEELVANRDFAVLKEYLNKYGH